jgi:hypothetical protein
MKIFLRKHIEGLSIAFIIVLVGVMVGGFFWGIAYISMSLNSALSFKPAPPQVVQFNIEGAKNLDLKGLLQP